jgi:hypothetical protein
MTLRGAGLGARKSVRMYAAVQNHRRGPLRRRAERHGVSGPSVDLDRTIGPAGFAKGEGALASTPADLSDHNDL